MKGGERTMTNERTFSKDKKERGGVSLRNLLNKKLKNEKGLTLIELLAVIVILAIIALIAIPAIGSIISNSKSKAVLSDATTVIASAKTAIADGVCAETKDSNGVVTATTCTKADLADMVEGVTLSDGDQVVKNGTVYTITYTKLNTLNEKYTIILNKNAGKGDDVKTKVTSATQDAIAKTMGNK